jgi:CHASE2 domain-containing sensor protein
MKIVHFVILAIGFVLSLLLYLSNIYIFNFDWKIPFIPIMIALQLVLLILAIKSRYKKH